MTEVSEQSSTELAEDCPQPEISSNGKHLNPDAAGYYKQVALNMRRARRKLKLTQQQIADAMGIPRSTYKSLESGNTGIYCYHMAKWSKITGFDVRVLTRGTGYDLTSEIKNYQLVEKTQYLTSEQVQAVMALVDAFDK